jgi:hypothetical protein
VTYEILGSVILAVILTSVISGLGNDAFGVIIGDGFCKLLLRLLCSGVFSSMPSYSSYRICRSSGGISSAFF